MFKKSIYKIVGAIMGILVVLFAGTLSIIYFSSYRQVYQSNMEMLENYAEAYWKNGNPDEQETQPPQEKEDGLVKSEIQEKTDEIVGDNSFLSAGFYSVAISNEDEVVSIDNSDTMRISDEDLVTLCENVQNSEKQNGNLEEWIYYISENEDITLVVLMDNVLISSSITTLFKNTLLYGGIVLIIMIFPAFFLASRIVRPLEESDRKQKQFISDASHELKTPIAVISTNAEMLNREMGENRWLSNIQYENRQMGDLVRQLLNLARAENVSPAMQNINISQVVMGSVLPFEGVAFDKQIRLESDIAENVCIHGNGEQIGILVSILVDNALEYSQKEGTVKVSLKKEHHAVLLEVCNAGDPIPKQIQERLFERFYRVNDEREHESGHYGLGLAIAKAIVTSHDGKINVECKDGQVIFIIKFSERKLQ